MNESILEEASRLVNGERALQYGDSNVMLERIAELWAPILHECVNTDPYGPFAMAIYPRHVALCLIQLKVARELNSSKRDNAVDIAGYAEILGRAQEAETETLRESDRTYRDQVRISNAGAAINDFISRGWIYGDEKERKELLGTFFREYLQHTGAVTISPEHAERIVEKLKEASDLLTRGRINVLMHFDPKFASDTLGIYLTWVEPKTDPQNEKTDSENPKCQATDAKSEAAPMFKPGDFAMIDGVRHQVHKIEGGKATVNTEKHAPYLVNAYVLSPVETDPANPESPAAEPSPERVVGKHPALGAGYELGEGVIEALWRKLGKFTWVVVNDGVKPYEGYGHGVVKDIVSCTATTGDGLRKIVKAVVEFPPSSLPNNAALPQTCTIPVEHLSISLVRRDYRKP